jgi:hypothetical protein
MQDGQDASTKQAIPQMAHKPPDARKRQRRIVLQVSESSIALPILIQISTLQNYQKITSFASFKPPDVWYFLQQL